jgi:SAM-dependent methyltransferase
MREPRDASKPPSYLFPRHHAEIDRLDIQHYALREVLGGNYVAPVRQPDRILDVGSGTGQWGFEVASEFPGCLMVGVDLVAGKPGGPPNNCFVKADLLRGLPFRDGIFDLVHQRLLMSAVPAGSWSEVVADLVRVARPGGWIELVEGAPEMGPAGPSTARLSGMLKRLAEAKGLDASGTVFRSLVRYLREAGVEEVRVREVSLPVGEWGGRIGSFMLTDARAMFMRLIPAFEAAFAVSTEELHGLLTGLQQEVDVHRTSYAFAVAWGRRPYP